MIAMSMRKRMDRISLLDGDARRALQHRQCKFGLLPRKLCGKPRCDRVSLADTSLHQRGVQHSSKPSRSWKVSRTSCGFVEFPSPQAKGQICAILANRSGV